MTRGTGTISDRFLATAVGPATFNVIFASDAEGSFPGLPALPPGAINLGAIAEDGTVQFVADVRNGVSDVDHFFMQSDVEVTRGVVPEPTSIALGGTALALLIAFRRKLIRLN